MSTEINPNHWETIYLFEWGETGAFGAAMPFSEPIGGLDNEPIEVTQEITGLTPGTIYVFRAVAANFRGTTEGEDVRFVTPDVPRVDLTVSESVGKTSAHLGGSVAAMTKATNVSFQYGPTTGYGQSTPQIPIGEDLISHKVGADVSNLTPGTTYHFRIAATNAIGTTYGPDRTFTTVAEPPTQKSTADCDRLSNRAKKKETKRSAFETRPRPPRASAPRNCVGRPGEASKQATKLNKEADACRSTSGGSGK